MAFDERTVAEIIRHRLKIPNSSKNAAIIFQIPTALEQLARKVAANPVKRPLLLTRPSETEIALTLGGVDLKSYNDTAPKKILVEFLGNGDIFYEDTVPRTLTAVQSIANGDWFYKQNHGLHLGQPGQFPTGSSLPGPGPTWVVDTTYYVIIPSQAQIDAAGFLNETPANFFKLAATANDAANGVVKDVTASQLTLIFRTNDGTTDTDPMEQVTQEQARRISNHPLYGDYRFYWMDGEVLRVVDPNSQNFLTGSLHFACPYQPATLTDLAGIKELHNDFLDKLEEICIGKGIDTAEDGEH